MSPAPSGRFEHDGSGSVAEQHAFVRSVQSTIREKVSAPITSARLCEPLRKNLSGCHYSEDKAGTHRLKVEGHAMGHPQHRLDLRCRGREGVVGGGCATMTRSMSDGVTPVCWRARAAFSPSIEVVSPSASDMPLP